MAELDDAIDALYRGPLDTFTAARNALAKSSGRADIKALAKPSLPAWTVNQLHWTRRGLLDRLEAAATDVRVAHQAALAGGKADIVAAERAHRELVREAAAAAKDVLVAGSHPATPATLDAIRETLAALPSPEASGRLTRALAARGLEALAGLVLAARVPGPTAAPAAPSRVAAPVAVATAPSIVAHTEARDAARREREQAREQAARERAARRVEAEAALERAREALAAADEAVTAAERDLATRQAERVAARDTVKQARRLVEELSFGR